jgi:ethanolamine utilization microcompartment shell protein EutS
MLNREAPSKSVFQMLGLKENLDKNDITILKKGADVEIMEARDIAGDIQFLTGEVTVTTVKRFFEAQSAVGHIGHVIVTVSAHEKCPQFLAFMKKQSRRLKFKLIVFISPLLPSEIPSLQQLLQERGAALMQ